MDTWKPTIPMPSSERRADGAAGDHEQGHHQRSVEERREGVEEREPSDGVAHRV